MPGWRRPSCGDRRARRGRRSRRVERPGDGRTGRPRHARADRGPPLPERSGPAARRAALGHPAPLPRGPRRPARGRPGRGDGPVSIGVDSWGVDYGLLDAAGRLLGDPYHYRDDADGGRRRRRSTTVVPRADLYARTGLQFLPFNTLYQLAAARGTAAFEAPRTMLLIPDLLGYWLSGAAVTEMTNASSTGLLDVHRRTWDTRPGRRRWSCRRRCSRHSPRRARSSVRCGTTSAMRPGSSRRRC